MKSRWTAAAALAGAVALTNVANAQISDNVVRLVVMNDQNSIYADAAGRGSVLAAQMAAEDAGGKIDGSPIEVVGLDHQNKADIAATLARKAFDVDKADAIFDIANSAASLAVQEIAKQADKVVVHVGSAHADLFGKACSPVGALWLYDTNSLAKGLARALYDDRHKNWFLVVADYAFGHAMQADLTGAVEKMGGKVVGAVRHPLNTNDFSSFLLQSAGKETQVLAMLNAGGDLTNSIKQAAEFGVAAKGVPIAAPIFNEGTAYSLGLKTAQGTTFLLGYYWNTDEPSRAFAKRFEERWKKPPSNNQAAVYSAVNHYLKGVAATKSDKGTVVMDKMKEMPVNDFMTRNATLRADGRLMRDMLLAQVKAPADSKSEWDLLKIRDIVPAAEIIRPMAEGGCPYIKG